MRASRTFGCLVVLAAMACGDGKDVVLGIDGDGGYDPCASKICGDTCHYCRPGDSNCVELAVTKWCDVKGECLPGVPPMCP